MNSQSSVSFCIKNSLRLTGLLALLLPIAMISACTVDVDGAELEGGIGASTAVGAGDSAATRGWSQSRSGSLGSGEGGHVRGRYRYNVAAYSGMFGSDRVRNRVSGMSGYANATGWTSLAGREFELLKASSGVESTIGTGLGNRGQCKNQIFLYAHVVGIKIIDKTSTSTGKLDQRLFNKTWPVLEKSFTAFTYAGVSVNVDYAVGVTTQLYVKGQVAKCGSATLQLAPTGFVYVMGAGNISLAGPLRALGEAGVRGTFNALNTAMNFGVSEVMKWKGVSHSHGGHCEFQFARNVGGDLVFFPLNGKFEVYAKAGLSETCNKLTNWLGWSNKYCKYGGSWKWSQVLFEFAAEKRSISFAKNDWKSPVIHSGFCPTTSNY